MAVHPIQWEIGRRDARIEAVVSVNDADHNGEAIRCADPGKVQADADAKIPRRVEGRKCADLVHVDHGDTSELIGYSSACYREMSSDQMRGWIDAVISLAREEMLLDTQSKATSCRKTRRGALFFLARPAGVAGSNEARVAAAK